MHCAEWELGLSLAEKKNKEMGKARIKLVVLTVGASVWTEGFLTYTNTEMSMCMKKAWGGTHTSIS
jgi:hypothetical protein